MVSESYDLQLFLGLPVTAKLEAELQKANPNIKKIFICNQGDYLHQVTYQGTSYLGKQAGAMTSLQELELLQANIWSLLDKVLPKQTDRLPQLMLILNRYGP